MTTEQKLQAVQHFLYIHALMRQNYQFYAYGLPIIMK